MNANHTPRYFARIVADDTHTYALLSWADAEDVMELMLCRRRGDEPWEPYAVKGGEVGGDLNDAQVAALDHALEKWELILAEAAERGG